MKNLLAVLFMATLASCASTPPPDLADQLNTNDKSQSGIITLSPEDMKHIFIPSDDSHMLHFDSCPEWIWAVNNKPHIRLTCSKTRKKYCEKHPNKSCHYDKAVMTDSKGKSRTISIEDYIDLITFSYLDMLP